MIKFTWDIQDISFYGLFSLLVLLLWYFFCRGHLAQGIKWQTTSLNCIGDCFLRSTGCTDPLPSLVTFCIGNHRGKKSQRKYQIPFDASWILSPLSQCISICMVRIEGCIHFMTGELGMNPVYIFCFVLVFIWNATRCAWTRWQRQTERWLWINCNSKGQQQQLTPAASKCSQMEGEEKSNSSLPSLSS